MSNPLVENFLENIKPQEKQNVEPLIVFMPRFSACIGIDMNWVNDVSEEKLNKTFNDLLRDCNVIEQMTNDLLEKGTEALDAVHDAIMGHASDIYRSIGVEIDEGDVDKMANTMLMLADTQAYTWHVCKYIEEHCDVSIVDTNVITPADDIDEDENSDEHFMEMLATELAGGTDGVEFTDEELYGETKENE